MTATLSRPRFTTLRSIIALILREMASTYGRSPGGYLWAVLEPLGAIAIMALGFSLMIHKPSLGSNFMLFYATGFLPIHIYGELSTKVMNTLRYSRMLLAYPRVLWIDAILARVALHLLTGIIVSILVIGGIIVLTSAEADIDPVPIAQGIGMVALIGAGIGTLNCYLTGRFEFWGRIWAIASRPIFFASGVFFLLDNVTEPLRTWLWWNPLIHGVGLVRAGFYPTYEATYASLTYGYSFGLIALVLGLILLRANHDRIL